MRVYGLGLRVQGLELKKYLLGGEGLGFGFTGHPRKLALELGPWVRGLEARG